MQFFISAVRRGVSPFTDKSCRWDSITPKTVLWISKADNCIAMTAARVPCRHDGHYRLVRRHVDPNAEARGIHSHL